MATPVKFYKKFSPETRIQLADGKLLQAFKVAVPGDVTGYFATNNPGLQDWFAGLMQQGRYALSEIPYEEFKRDYLDRRDGSPKPVWREEVGKSSAGLTLPVEAATRLAEEGRLSAVAVSGCDQPGRPRGVSMAESAAAAGAHQAVANSTIAEALNRAPVAAPQAGKRRKGAKPAGGTAPAA